MIFNSRLCIDIIQISDDQSISIVGVIKITRSVFVREELTLVNSQPIIGI